MGALRRKCIRLRRPRNGAKQRTRLRQQRYNENKLNITEQVGGWFTAASGGTLYNGDAWPKEYAGSVFTGDVSGNLVHQDFILPDGPTFRAHRAKENVEFLASTDVWFRPCNFTNAPDGNLYVIDFYRQVIEGPAFIPEEIRKKLNFLATATPWAAFTESSANHPLRRGDLKPNLGSLSSADLVKQLANPNGWHRWTAHRLLLERQDRSAVPDLKAMAANVPSPEARVACPLAFAGVRRAGTGGDRARAERSRLADSRECAAPERAIDEPVQSRWRNAVLAAANDSDPHVQFQAALTPWGLAGSQSPRHAGAAGSPEFLRSRGSAQRF